MMFGLYLLLNLAVLWFVARGSSESGWRLAANLFVLGWVVGSGNSLIEAIFFKVLTVKEALVPAIFGLILFATISPVALVLAGRWRKGGALREEGDFTAAKLIGVVVTYEVLYWSFGALVFPYIAHFYESRLLPPAYEVAAVQVARSLLFAASAYPLLKRGLRGAPLKLALVYAIIGGVAPLLLDNPFMPADIRFYHAIETTASNFIFGLVVGFLFGWGRRDPKTPAVA